MREHLLNIAPPQLPWERLPRSGVWGRARGKAVKGVPRAAVPPPPGLMLLHLVSHRKVRAGLAPLTHHTCWAADCILWLR